ncbi:MAG: dienelactone hydrolase family protein [Candidatus Marinimicrobia bacterium]|nr:dienelactone hydrolase family protein [Candidatus Neomarinimicrobiota bacterium]
MDQNVIDLYDQYTHSSMGRIEFLKRLAKLAGGMAAANAILPFIEVDDTVPGLVAGDEPGLISEHMAFEGPDGKIMAYIARPADDIKRGGVVVVHENRGLNTHIEDVARRLAMAGFIAVAPDALSPLGGTPGDRDEARSMIGRLDRGATLRLFLSALKLLRDHPQGNGKVGCVGFCWGGGMVNQLAVSDASLNAAVSFYGRQAAAADVSNIKAHLMLHYAGLDRRINAGIDTYREALDRHKIDYDLYLYDGVNHAFHNDTAPTRYNEAAAKLAWKRTVELFDKTLM